MFSYNADSNNIDIHRSKTYHAIILHEKKQAKMIE